MLFPTVEFAIYFPIVLALSWALMPHLQWWKVFIVGASYLFYGSANWKFCFLLAGVTLGNQLFARLIARADGPEYALGDLETLIRWRDGRR